MSAMPHTNGTATRCFLPYMTKPTPIDPRSKPKKSEDALIDISSRRVVGGVILTTEPTMNMSVEKGYSNRLGHSMKNAQRRSRAFRA